MLVHFIDTLKQLSELHFVLVSSLVGRAIDVPGINKQPATCSVLKRRIMLHIYPDLITDIEGIVKAILYKCVSLSNLNDERMLEINRN